MGGTTSDGLPEVGDEGEAGTPGVPVPGTPGPAPRPMGRATARRTVPAEAARRRTLAAPERVLLLDAWMRSRLAASEFAALVGLSAATLYQWKKRFEARGPAGLEDGPRGRRGGSRLPEPVRRAIVMLKRAHPDWGQDRIHDVLLRSQGYGASPGAVARVLEEEGYVVEEAPTTPHEAPVRRFERARPNELWQTDLFTFILKRENRRVHLVNFMDSCEATGYVESRRPAP